MDAEVDPEAGLASTPFSGNSVYEGAPRAAAGGEPIPPAPLEFPRERGREESAWIFWRDSGLLEK